MASFLKVLRRSKLIVKHHIYCELVDTVKLLKKNKYSKTEYKFRKVLKFKIRWITNKEENVEKENIANWSCEYLT